MTCSRSLSSFAMGCLAMLGVASMASNDAQASFGVSGRAITNLGAAANAVVLQPDGKLVAAGLVVPTPSSAEFVLVRFNADGNLDTSFGSGGAVATAFAGADSAVAVALVLQPDGKLVAAGSIINGGFADFALARYDADGTLDPSFGTDGLVTTDIAAGFAQARSLVLQADGKLVAAGFTRTATFPDDPDFALVRYNIDGTLDATFGTGGKVTTDLGGADEANAVVLQPDGKLVAAGRGGPMAFAKPMDFVLARYDADGTLDASFGSGGMATTGLGAAEAEALVLQPDGKLVAAGTLTVGNNGNLGDFELARYDADGTLDASFGTSGTVTTHLSTSEASALVLQPDGKLVAAGRSVVDGSFEFTLARYVADGSLDAGFGSGGVATTDFGGVFDGAAALVLQPDGKLVSAGGTGRRDSTLDVALLRSNTDGTRDACAAAPEPGCRLSRHALLTLTSGGPNHSDHLTWQWRNGALTTLADLGSPETTSGYQLCIYDPNGPRLGIGVPPGDTCDGKPCWIAPSTGFTYRNRDLTPDGVFKLVLRAGADGKAKILLDGRGPKLGLPTLPFASLPITVQVKRPDGGECWETAFPAAIKNESGRFKATGGTG